MGFGGGSVPEGARAGRRDVDEAAVARRLGEAVQFRTVSHQDADAFDAAQFAGFVDWVERSYPEVGQAMQRVLLDDYTMLYRWSGSDRDLQPILITAHYDVVPVIPGTESHWTCPPYAGAIVDGIVWGRGALDDQERAVPQPVEALARGVRTYVQIVRDGAGVAPAAAR